MREWLLAQDKTRKTHAEVDVVAEDRVTAEVAEPAVKVVEVVGTVAEEDIDGKVFDWTL